MGSIRVVRFEATPNPNALKCVVEPSPTDAPRSYFNHAQAVEADDALAVALFSIPSVTNVLIHRAFITVGKEPEGSWASIRPKIRAALAGQP